MSTSGKEIEYEFEDLRRNTDELPTSVLEQLEVDDDTGALSDADDSGDRGDAGDNADEEMVPLSEVNKRIAKVRRESQRNIDAAKDEATTVIADLTKRVSTMEVADEDSVLETEQKSNVERIELAIETAMEAGEGKEVTKLTIELAELTATNVTKREALKVKRAAEHDEPDDLNKRTEPSVIPRAKDWLAEQDWWDDKELAHVVRFVNRLDKALQQKGYSPHDDDFYEQLEEAVEKKYPGIIIHTMDDDDGLGLDDDDNEDAELDAIPDKRTATKKKARRAARRQPVGGKDSGGRRQPRNRQRGSTLDRNQLANMRMFGMDPDNKEHIEAYMEGAGIRPKGGK